MLDHTCIVRHIGHENTTAMKRKIVLWGTNEKDEKILVALHLKDKEGVVDLYTFDEEMATEDFYNAMLNQWRENVEVEMPEGHQVVQRPLNISDSILPDTVKVQRTDIIARAQTEWHFVVLSAKLYEMYRSELEDLSDTVENLKEYDNKIWTEMRNFWSKVQEQVNEKNLFRDHAATLKSKTNKMFDQLKTLKKDVEAKYEETSTQYKETILGELGDIESKIEKGLGLKPIFEELKQLQSRLRGMKFTKKDRDVVWNKVDAAFKVVKEKRFGDKGKGQAGSTNAVGRHQGRLDGLENAIQKMEKSISRDKEDQKYQNRKIETTDGQLEMQIRQAKIKMIDERVRSKEVKLEDMYKTRTELQSKVVKEKAKEQKREEMAKAKAAAEAKIAAEVKKSAEIVEASADKLEEAVAKVAEGKKAAPITPVVLPNDEGAPAEESKSAESKILEMPVQEVIIDNTEHTAEADQSSKAADDEEPKANKTEDSLLGAIGSTLGEALGGIEDALEDVMDTVKAVAEVVENKIEDAVEDIKERMNKEEEE